VRTTVTLDEDAEQMIRERMAQRGVSFKQALNDSIREGNRRRVRRQATRTASLGTPTVSLDRALQLAAELEDEDLIRRMRSGG
jgi:hypothetical protein